MTGQYLIGFRDHLCTGRSAFHVEKRVQKCRLDAASFRRIFAFLHPGRTEMRLTGGAEQCLRQSRP